MVHGEEDHVGQRDLLGLSVFAFCQALCLFDFSLKALLVVAVQLLSFFVSYLSSQRRVSEQCHYVADLSQSAASQREQCPLKIMDQLMACDI